MRSKHAPNRIARINSVSKWLPFNCCYIIGPNHKYRINRDLLMREGGYLWDKRTKNYNDICLLDEDEETLYRLHYYLVKGGQSFYEVFIASGKYKTALKLALKCKLNTLYANCALNINIYLTMDNIFEFWDLYLNHPDADYLCVLVEWMDRQGENVRDKFQREATTRHLKGYVNNVLPDFQKVMFVVEWMRADTNRFEQWDDWVDSINWETVQFFTFQKFNDCFQNINDWDGNVESLYRSLVRRMLRDQTKVLFYDSADVELFVPNRIGELELKMYNDVCNYIIIKAICLDDECYVLATLKNQEELTIFHVIEEFVDKMEPLMVLPKKYFVDVIGSSVIVIYSDDNPIRKVFQINVFDVTTGNKKSVLSVKIDFEVSEIVCSRNFVYFLKYNESNYYYDRICRLNWTTRETRDLPTRGTRPRTRSSDIAVKTTTHDGYLVILNFENIFSHDCEGTVTTFIKFYKDHHPRNWEMWETKTDQISYLPEVLHIYTWTDVIGSEQAPPVTINTPPPLFLHFISMRSKKEENESIRASNEEKCGLNANSTNVYYLDVENRTMHHQRIYVNRTLKSTNSISFYSHKRPTL